MSEHHIAAQIWFEEEPAGTADDFAEFVNRVQEEIDAIEAPVSIAANLTERMIDFAAIVHTKTAEDASSELLGYARTALHAAECSTAGWPRTYRAERQSVEELQDA